MIDIIIVNSIVASNATGFGILSQAPKDNLGSIDIISGMPFYTKFKKALQISGVSICGEVIYVAEFF